jgi:hypothetical protein
VQDPEVIYFAVFQETPVNGANLAADSFETGALKRSEQSVSRASFTGRQIFDQHVVRAGVNPKGAITGVAAALVENIRSLTSRIQLPGKAEKLVRSFCVLDLVLQGDYNSHATIGFGERTKPHEEAGITVSLSQGQIKTIRAAAMMELADAFGPVQPIDLAVFAED